MKTISWKKIFCEQLDNGKYWKELFKDDFDKHLFLDRSDAVYICKKAQADIYDKIIFHLANKVDVEVINELINLVEIHWETDDSALGMYINGEQITE